MVKGQYSLAQIKKVSLAITLAVESKNYEDYRKNNTNFTKPYFLFWRAPRTQAFLPRCCLTVAGLPILRTMNSESGAQHSLNMSHEAT